MDMTFFLKRKLIYLMKQNLVPLQNIIKLKNYGKY